MGKQILGIILFKVVTTDISSRYLIPYCDGHQKDYRQKKKWSGDVVLSLGCGLDGGRYESHI